MTSQISKNIDDFSTQLAQRWEEGLAIDEEDFITASFLFPTCLTIILSL